MAKAIGKRRIGVLGSQMTYMDTRAGEHQIVLLHGNPTSSYVWRNLVPCIQGLARCLAPDLIGMGDSSKVAAINYDFHDHRRYLRAWLDGVQLDKRKKIIFIGHEWGAALALDWIREHPERTEAFVHMEAILTSFQSYSQLGNLALQNVIKQIRMCDSKSDRNVLGKAYLEMCLDDITENKKLTKDNLETYKRPYLESSRAVTALVRQLPLVTEGPNDVMDLLSSNLEWLKTRNGIPLMQIVAEDGRYSEMNKNLLEGVNQATVVVKGGHYLTEGGHAQIGEAIRNFVRSL